MVCALIDGEPNVTELLERVAASQPNVQARRRTGAQIHYRGAHAQIRRLCLVLKGHGPAVGLP